MDGEELVTLSDGGIEFPVNTPQGSMNTRDNFLVTFHFI